MTQYKKYIDEFIKLNKVQYPYGIPEIDTKDFQIFMGGACQSTIQKVLGMSGVKVKILNIKSKEAIVKYNKTLTIGIPLQMLTSKYYETLYGEVDSYFVVGMVNSHVIAEASKILNAGVRNRKEWQKIADNISGDTRGAFTALSDITHIYETNEQILSGNVLYRQELRQAYSLGNKIAFNQDFADQIVKNYKGTLIEKFVLLYFMAQGGINIENFPDDVKEIFNEIMRIARLPFEVRYKELYNLANALVALEEEQDTLTKELNEADFGETNLETLMGGDGLSEDTFSDDDSNVVSNFYSQTASQSQPEETPQQKLIKIYNHKDFVQEINVKFYNIVDHEQFGLGTRRLVIDEKFRSLGDFIIKARQVKEVLGSPQKRGKMQPHLLHKLANSDDSHIMAKRTSEKEVPNKPEVIILVDISGSTEKQPDKNSEKFLYEIQLEAAMGAFLSLKNANIPCSVYTHTTGEHNETRIDFIASFDAPNPFNKRDNYDNFSKRFETVHRIGHSGNNDPDAMLAVSKMFSNRQTQNVLIVVSDGAPSGASVEKFISDGQHSGIIDATVETIKFLRQNSIAVYSVSTSSYIVDANDKIYGVEYNIDASKNITKELTKLLKGIVI